MTNVRIRTKRADAILTRDDVIAHTNLEHSINTWASFRGQNGFKAVYAPLLSPPDANMKLEKSVAYGLALAPANTSGYNVCPHSTPECRRGCVASAGNGAYPRVVQARIVRTHFLLAYPAEFMAILVHEIGKARTKAEGQLFVRLNTFSDINWSKAFPWLFDLYNDVQFYDYTKVWSRIGDAPGNYAMAGSVSEKTTAGQILDADHPLAVVFDTKKGKPLPDEYWGLPVVDADKSDRWMVDYSHQAVIGGLRAKGRLRKGNSPFVYPA